MTHMTPLIGLAEQAYRQQRIQDDFRRSGGERRHHRLPRLRRNHQA
jgi:hypothetical protein